MKRTFAIIRTMAAMLIASAAFTACSVEDNSSGGKPPALEQEYTLIIEASMGDGARTRSLSLDGQGKLTATWENGDQVTVTNGAASLGTLTVSNISADGQVCTISGTLKGNVAPGDRLALNYLPQSSLAAYAQQNGTMASAGNYYMARAMLTIVAINEKVIMAKEAEAAFETLTSVLKITLTDGSTALNASKLRVTATVSGATTDLFEFNPTAETYKTNGADGVLYLALPCQEAVTALDATLTEQVLQETTLTFTATVGGNIYTAEQKGYAYAPGQYYETMLTMTKPAGTYLSTIKSHYTATDGETLIGTLSSRVSISIADGATVTLNNATIMGSGYENEYYWPGINCQGDATIILKGANKVRSYDIFHAGINVPDGKTLTIQGDGSLEASTLKYGAGIGGRNGWSSGNIVINSGTITATGGNNGAGIGGANDGATRCGNITINGGTITATGGQYAAGIGAGWGLYYGTGGHITINGGTITATGGYGAPAIGSGESGSCGDITIARGVTLTATGGQNTKHTIGAGTQGNCGSVTIGGRRCAGGITQNPFVYPGPEGVVNGIFTVSPSGRRVYFSQGNLQYVGTWQFAERQWDRFWLDQRDNHRDLFLWGTGDNPNNTSQNNYSHRWVDWGNNTITNGGSGNYRSLTADEWRYLLAKERSAKRGAATVNGIVGLVILPDEWTQPSGCSFKAGNADQWTTNVYSAEQWTSMELQGALFLPWAGSLRSFGPAGGFDYWSSTEKSATEAYTMGYTINWFVAGESKSLGFAVRLVKDIE